MKYYLSSYQIGNFPEKLVELSGGGIIGCITNALDFIPKNELLDTPQLRGDDLKSIGISTEVLDLRDFFSNSSTLSHELERFSGVWVIGGNVFVLRQAMKLSGFDKAIEKLRLTDFLYSGFSAGICVLAPNLEAYKIVDSPDQFPYPEQRETIWEGLGIMNQAILPHYQSDHPESAAIDREVEYCKINKIPFKTLTDGEVLYGDNIDRLSNEIRVSP